jgi:hypothetical protein
MPTRTSERASDTGTNNIVIMKMCVPTVSKQTITRQNKDKPHAADLRCTILLTVRLGCFLPIRAEQQQQFHVFALFPE